MRTLVVEKMTNMRVLRGFGSGHAQAVPQALLEYERVNWLQPDEGEQATLQHRQVWGCSEHGQRGGRDGGLIAAIERPVIDRS